MKGWIKKKVDFVVDKDYLVSEVEQLVRYKKEKDLNIWINPHGEPTLYSKLPQLCDDLLYIKEVSTVSIITNGTLLIKPLVDALHIISSKHKKKIQIALSLSVLRDTVRR